MKPWKVIGIVTAIAAVTVILPVYGLLLFQIDLALVLVALAGYGLTPK